MKPELGLFPNNTHRAAALCPALNAGLPSILPLEPVMA
jgi:hypothetical protein